MNRSPAGSENANLAANLRELSHRCQCTVVTEPRGPFATQRVERGREAECLALVKPAGEA